MDLHVEVDCVSIDYDDNISYARYCSESLWLKNNYYYNHNAQAVDYLP